MTTDYQLGLLCYLVQSPEGSTYIDHIEDDLFDLVEYQLTLQVLKKYHKKYNTLPGRVAGLQFLEEQISLTKGLNANIANDLREVMEDIFVPLSKSDSVKLKDTIIVEVQSKNLDKLFMDFAAGSLTTDQVFSKMNKISSFVGLNHDDHKNAGFLVEDRGKHYDEQVEGNPTFLHDLNKLTAARGFYSPQLIVFMSGPKHFKTGLIINIAVEYARDGYNVYYADGENGARSIRNRVKQKIMDCTLEDLFDSSIYEELDDTLYRFGKYMGGDLYIDEFPANQKSIKDIEARLEFLREEYGWVPDIIVYDSIDHFIPSKIEDQKRDVRIKIQLVYHEAISLNKRWETFAIVPSQVNREAILRKKTFDITDLSEDFGKAMNAHAIFAICATPEEEEKGVRRIVPIAQREGVAYRGKSSNMCIIQIKEDTMQVYEVDKDKYLEGLVDD